MTCSLRALALLAGSFLAAVLAMFTKEIAFTLPLAVALFELTFFRGEWKRRLLFLLPLLATLPIIPLGVLFGGGEEASAGVDEQLRAHSEISRLHYLLTQFRVLITYLRLLIFPTGQNLDYDYPVFTTFFTLPVVLSFLALAAFFGLGVYLHLRARPSAGVGPGNDLSRDPSLRLISFGIFWFFLGLSVESSLIPIFDVIFEHRLYLPSIGFFVAVAALLFLAAQATGSIANGKIPLVAAALLVVAFSVATFQRNAVWQSNTRLWGDVVRKSPEKARPWYNLGTYLVDEGRLEEAIPALSRTLQIDPQKADAWHNLGRAHLVSGNYGAAVPSLREAVRLAPELENAVVNLAVALIHVGRPDEAVGYLEGVRRRLPNWPEARLNLGIAYLQAGNLPAAQSELAFLYRHAPRLAPNLAEQIQRAEIAN
ncbi:MAG: tetratricopeptide repeat protein [Desulfuromonadales bacterium]|nr:tetratricopeptide repeat protein [Desulfuromonadales bacterium]